LRYLLDTSAILALYQDEPGSESVQRLFEARDRGDVALYVSFMTIFELTCLSRRRMGSDEAFMFLLKVRMLGMEEVWPDEDILSRAAEMKLKGGVSTAHAFIAACAASKAAILVHRDPEFARLDGLQSITL